MKWHEPFAEKNRVFLRSVESEEAVLSSIVLDKATDLAEVFGHLGSADWIVFEYQP
jgi:hypothetical protein